MTTYSIYSGEGCFLATDNSIFTPGENNQCENSAKYPVMGKLHQYFPNVKVCKEHAKYLLRHEGLWLKAFQEAKIDKGLDMQDLQSSYAKQAFFSHVIVQPKDPLKIKKDEYNPYNPGQGSY